MEIQKYNFMKQLSLWGIVLADREKMRKTEFVQLGESLLCVKIALFVAKPFLFIVFAFFAPKVVFHLQTMVYTDALKWSLLARLRTKEKDIC